MKSLFQQSMEDEAFWILEPKDENIIAQIIERAVSIAKSNSALFDELQYEMSLVACHKHCVPLDLECLLNAPEDLFFLELNCLYWNLNKETIQFENGYVPHFAKAQGGAL